MEDTLIRDTIDFPEDLGEIFTLLNYIFIGRNLLYFKFLPGLRLLRPPE